MSDAQPAATNRMTILAIDPGRSKCGVAVVAADDEPELSKALLSQIIETQSLIVEMAEIVRKFPQISTVVLGNGTQSRTLRRVIQSRFSDLSVVLVEEHGTSLRARAQYLAEHPPQGLQRLLPLGLRTPDRPIDDIVALILAREYFTNQQKNLQQ